MSKKLLLVCLFFPLIAFAGGAPDPDPQEQSQGQAQGQEQSQEQSQDVTTEVNSEGGDATATGGNGGSVTFQAKDNTPNIFSGYIAPSDPCMGGANGALSVPGFGIGGGKTTINPDCERREWFRVMMQSGHTEIAMKIWCASPYSKEAGMEFCNDYSTKPEGWQEKKESYSDMSQFNEKRFTAEECDEREGRKTLACLEK